MSAHDRTALRAMVRDVIREALADLRGGSKHLGAAEPVRIASDADLAAFVARLVELMADPAKAARIASGVHRFTLATGAVASTPGPSAASEVHGHAGLVNERTIAALPDGATLHLAPGAVVTPLARDKARQRRIKLERIR